MSRRVYAPAVPNAAGAPPKPAKEESIMSSNVVRISGLAASLGGVLVAVYAAIAASMPRGCIGEIECATR